MATIASLNIALTADSAQLNRALTAAEARSQRYARRTQSAYQRLNRSITNLTRSFGAFVALLGANQILQNVDELLKLSQAAQINFGDFQRLAFVFEQAGIQTQRMARGIVVLTQRIQQLGDGSQLVTRDFTQLGITFQEISDLSPEDQFLAVLQALREVSDESQRAAISANLFGTRLAVQLGPILNTTAEDLQRLGDSINVIELEDAQNIEVFNDAVANLGRALTRLATQFSPALTAFSRFADRISSLIDDFPQLANIITGILTVALVRRLIPAVFGSITSIRAFTQQVIQGTTAMRVFAAQTDAAVLGASRYARGITRATTPILGWSRAVTVGAFASRGLSIAAAGLRVALAAVGGPFGLLINAGILLATVFYDQIIAALREAANWFIRLYNTAANFFNEFLGGDTIPTLEEFSGTLQETADSTENLNDALANLETAVGEDQFDDPIRQVSAFQQALESAMDTSARLSEAGASAFNGITDALTDLVTTGMASFADLARAIIRDLIRIAIQAAITRAITGSVFGPGGGVGSFLGSIFGGISGRQFGGPVNAGRPYVVGEAGPELFVPTAAGSVIPNDQFTQASSVGDVTIVNQIGPNVSARQVGDSVGSIFMDLINNTSLDQGAGVVSRVREAV